jgi:hypothetical protein
MGSFNLNTKGPVHIISFSPFFQHYYYVELLLAWDKTVQNLKFPCHLPFLQRVYSVMWRLFISFISQISRGVQEVQGQLTTSHCIPLHESSYDPKCTAAPTVLCSFSPGSRGWACQGRKSHSTLATSSSTSLARFMSQVHSAGKGGQAAKSWAPQTQIKKDRTRVLLGQTKYSYTNSGGLGDMCLRLSARCGSVVREHSVVWGSLKWIACPQKWAQVLSCI